MKKSQQSALRRLAVTALVTIASAGTAVTAQAAYIVNATEIGGNVVFEGEGSLDLTAWNFIGFSAGTTSSVEADNAILIGGVANPDVDLYGSATSYAGPTDIGPGTSRIFAQSETGDSTAIEFRGILFTPRDYITRSPLSGSSTYTSATFDSLGLTPGTYEWTWGSGASADSFTLNVGAVPIPAAAWLFGSGLLGLVGVARRKARA